MDKLAQFKKERCPMCGALMFVGATNTETCDIQWVPTESVFLVKIRIGVCRMCSRSTNQYEIFKNIPVIIENNSTCTCGSPMTLSDHRIISDKDSVTFEGRYVCSKCEKLEKTLIKKFVGGIKSFWKTTKKIKIGPDGISYEKETKK